MAGDDGQERTQQPTAKRRATARQDGKVARSPEFTSASVTLAGVALLGATGTAAIGALAASQLRSSTASLALGAELGGGDLVAALRGAILATVGALLPLFAVVVVSAVASGLAMTRGLFSFKSIAFKWSNINPASGLKRMVGSEAVVTLLRSLLKVGGIGALAWMVLSAAQPELLALAGAGPGGIATVIRSVAFKLAWVVGIAFFVVAAVDWVWRWYQLEKSLRMTLQEVKQEYRESEGDPMVKARQQSMARGRARQLMLQNVRKADVVVVNPVHVAVALKYDLDEGPTPIVVAMGERLLAQRIKDLARQHDVPIVENPPVARALLASSQVGRPIPPALYAAIAEILAFVYRQRGRLPGGGRLTLDGGRS